MKKNVIQISVYMILTYIMLIALDTIQIQRDISYINYILQKIKYGKIIGITISIYLFYPFLGYILLVSFIRNNCLLSNYSLICFLILQLYINSVLKLISFEYRPYQLNSKIMSYDCELDYGMPSGHLYFLATFLVIMKYNYYDNRNNMNLFNNNTDIQNLNLINDDRKYLNKDNNYKYNFNKLSVKSGKSKNFFIKYYTIINIILFIILGFGRIINGAHSITQVIIGFIIGNITSEIYYNYLDYNIKLLCYKLLKKHKTDEVKIIIKILLFLIIIPYLFINIQKIRINKELNDKAINNINKNCKYDSNWVILEYKNINDTLYISIILFCIVYLYYFRYHYEFNSNIYSTKYLKIFINKLLLIAPIIGVFIAYDFSRNKIYKSDYYVYLVLYRISELIIIVSHYFILHPNLAKLCKIEIEGTLIIK